MNDGDSLVPAVGGFGPGFPVSFAYNGVFWLAMGRENSTAEAARFMLNSTNASVWQPHPCNLVLDEFGPGASVAFVNNKWFAVQGGGLFSSLNGRFWTRHSTLPLFSTSATTYPGAGGPVAFAISPFEEYWGTGGVASNGTLPPPVFVYSINGVDWDAQAPYIPFSLPFKARFQQVFSMTYGAGMFVILGWAEGSNAQVVENTILAATDPSTLTGLGKVFFLDNRTGNFARVGRAVIYSERESLFVFCGATGNQGGTSMAWSVNPLTFGVTRGTSGNAIGMFDNVCLHVATRTDLFSTLSGAASGTLDSTRVVPRAFSITVDGSLNVVTGDLKCGGQLTVSASGLLNSSGSLYFAGTTRIVQGATLTAGIAAIAYPLLSVLEIDVRSFTNGSSSVIIPLFNYTFAVGGFARVRSINSVDSCSVFGTPVITYSSSFASALISVDSSACSGTTEGNALSSGAIVGIAIGAGVVGIALVIGIVLVTKALISRYTSTIRSDLKMEDMRNLKAAQSTF